MFGRINGLETVFSGKKRCIFKLASSNAFIRLRRRPRPWPCRNASLWQHSSRQQTCCASADFASRRMIRRSLGVGRYICRVPRACPCGSIFAYRFCRELVRRISQNKAWTNSVALNSFRSSIPSPTPMYRIGIFSSSVIPIMIPPLAVPSNLVRAMPVTPMASLKSFA